MPSFDIVCEIDQHEVTNAVDQANREVTNRFDFKGSGAQYTLNAQDIELSAEVDFQLQQMLDILHAKLTKRNIDLKHLEVMPPVIMHKSASQQVKLIAGISKEDGKKLIKRIKEEKFKVQAAIMGDEVRVTGKKIDELQAVITFLKKIDLKLPIQFKNFRD